jgi:hypothetical protein
VWRLCGVCGVCGVCEQGPLWPSKEGRPKLGLVLAKKIRKGRAIEDESTCMPFWRKEDAQAYSKVGTDDDDVQLEGLADEARRGVEDCPSERAVWPEFSASFFSRLVFGWYTPLIKLGSVASLELSDVWSLAPGDSSEPNAGAFWKLWQEEVARAERKTQGGKPTIPWLGVPIVRFTWKRLVNAAVMRLLADFLQFGQPLLMQQILLVCEGDPDNPAIVSEQNAWVLGIAMAACSYSQFLLSTHYDNIVNRVALRLRFAIVGALYKKSIILSTGAKAAYSSGKIVNMMSNGEWAFPVDTPQTVYLSLNHSGNPGVNTESYRGANWKRLCQTRGRRRC